VQSGDERARRRRAAGARRTCRASRSCARRSGPTRSCNDNEACRRPFEDAAASLGDRAAAPWRERLAQLAVRSSDPAVYAYAVQACRGAPPSGRGSRARRSRWSSGRGSTSATRRPWLYLADAARARNDSAALVDALQHAAQADQMRAHGQSLVRSLLASRAAGAEPRAGALATIDIVGMQVGWAPPSYGGAMRYCSEAPPAAARARPAASWPTCWCASPTR
jgi:hypothetical protein